ncbi:ATP-dependent DNA helicase UvrD2 [Kineosporia sp. R_H_3]|uniref:ATP-dependent DNA helicase UvrD2 n=1 Tax=Kineosporia sp. R_H_3 TaxID=1961848 RepID=UPI000B4A9B39|nr:ATP-dependent DNA helicase UvrD2 [Kineosporia sp. R_H_3]
MPGPEPVLTTLLPSADGVLAALDPEQREVASALHGPVCVLAGAGTGKTRAITHRIAYGVHSGVYVPQQVLAVTFTARAAGEMRTRLRALGVGGVQARTFHAAALRQLSYFWPQAVGGAPPAIQEHKAGLVADAAARMRLTVDRAAIRDLAAEIEWAKVTLLTPERYVAAATRAGRGEPGGFDLPTVGRVLELYEDVKTDRGVIDFEDVLLLTVGILEEYPAVAATIRGQYRHFVVDEYQDVSALQQRLLDLWLGDREDVCVVGDPAQTIYSFTGASPEHLLAFPKRHPGTRTVRLERNYRSTPQVVALANGLLATSGPAGTPATARLTLTAQREAGPAPTLTAYDDDLAEASGVVREVTRLMEAGVRPSEIAVLYRTNAQAQPLESALADAGISYLVRGGERFFQRKEVRDAVLLLRGAARASDGTRPLGDEVRSVLASAGWTPVPPSTGGAVRERWESLQALAVLADELAAARPGTVVTDLVAELEERAAAQHAPTVEGVTLASFHAAKGLEWAAVLLVGLSEGLMPISLAQGWEAVEEERRLLYVGITRAREHLLLSWTRSRTPGGRATREPSRFLDGLIGAPAGRAPQGGSRGPGRDGDGPRRSRSKTSLPTACRVCGTVLSSGAERKTGRCGDCPPAYDPELFARLREWRARVAAEAKVPAYVVLTDATLVAVAEAVPRDVASLAAIAGVGKAKLDRYGAALLAELGAGSGPPNG